MNKKQIIFCCFLLVVLSFSIVVFAKADTPFIRGDSVSGVSGATVDVEVRLTNNVGILGAALTINFDENLTLNGFSVGDAFSELTFTPPGNNQSPCTFLWDGEALSDEDIKDGVILNLQFKISEEALPGEKYDISISCDDGQLRDLNLKTITPVISNGKVSILDYIPGDLNVDNKVDIADVIMLRRHFAGGYMQTINTYAIDINADGCTSISDLILLRRYLAGGYNVELLPGKSDYYEVETGMLQAVFETSLTGDYFGLNKYEIMIDDMVYNISDVEGLTIDDLYAHLGKKILVAYEQGASKRILKTYSVLEPKKITIAADDINDVNGYTIEYYASKTATKVTEAQLSNDLYVVYNGYGVHQSEIDTEFIKKYLSPENGEITLMDSVGDDKYDVVWVTNFETYYVTSVSLAGDVFKVKDGFTGKEVSFDRRDCVGYRVSSEVLQKHKIEDISSLYNIITRKSILSIAKPYDRTEGTVIIISSVKLFNKEVTAMSGYDEITIDGDVYCASKYFRKLVESDSKTYGFGIGDEGTFYLDCNRNIVYYDTSEIYDGYAYVLSFDKGIGFNGECEICMMPIDSSAKTFGFNSFVKVNGVSMQPVQLGQLLKNNANRITEKWNGITLENAKYSQLVRYRASGDILTHIATIDVDNLANGDIVPGQIDTGDGKDYFSTGVGLKVSNTSGTSRTFVNESGNTQFIINSTTKVLEISKDRGSDKSVKVKNFGYFSSTSTEYIVEPYDIKNGIATVVLVYVPTSSSATIYTNSNVAFVEKITSKKNDEGETVQVLTYCYAGETSTKETYAETIDTIPSNIKTGDMIRLAIENDEIIGVQSVFVGGVLYDYSTSDVYEPIEATGNYIQKEHNDDPDYYNVIYGTVHASAIEKNAGIIMVVPTVDTYKESEANAKTFDIKSSTKIYKWDDDNCTLVTGVAASEIYAALNETTFDCEAATKVVIVTINNTLKCVYIIEE